MKRRPPRSTLFPSTTLSRSDLRPHEVVLGVAAVGAGAEDLRRVVHLVARREVRDPGTRLLDDARDVRAEHQDRKSTRLNSSHANISYAVFCLKKKKIKSILV